MLEEVGFGVVGVGTWGDIHARIFKTDPRSKLVAICDKDEKRAKEAAQRYGAPKYYTDVAEMVKNPEIKAVSVATPDFAHKDVAVAAAKAGKHILVEKPLATTSADCKEIIEAARASKVKLMVDYHNRFNPVFTQAREAVLSGELGKVVHGDIKHSDTLAIILAILPWASKSSAMWFLGSHAVDILRWVVNDEVARVFCVTPHTGVLKEHGIESPDCFQTILEFSNGAVFTMENSWVLPESQPNTFDYRFNLVGSKGAVKINVAQNDAIIKYSGKHAVSLDTLVIPTVHNKLIGYAAESIRHFISCVTENVDPIPTGEDGLAVTRIIEAIYKSIETGRMVEVKEIQ